MGATKATAPPPPVRPSRAPHGALLRHPGPGPRSSLEASARERASAAACSASARALEFEASVEAEITRADEAARRELEDVVGRGNATADVSLTGTPRAETGGLPAVVVNITNRTDRTASCAVRSDFRDPDGKVVETRYAGVENLGRGRQK